ncbi:CAP-associated domain-containing protein [Staphylococcus sp. SQ8-PEA]|uniref:CAP-associated domain-containing protein n=1 Tax=Staphylococcus marylandisciuri TaxID=2981529 RepID=A0ABT2QNX3_9STAP|nr:CAP-associated domain-containing protein [Staphylococcus marylandisciuri]MCU5745687.1 CAP-associated domain-containing protein [Staphylococcus marylandisciuri]
MGRIILKVLGVIVVILVIIYLFYSPRLKFDVLKNPNKHSSISSDKAHPSHHTEEAQNTMPKHGIGTWVGKSLNKLTKKFGQADRVYPFYNSYKNYVFKRKNQYYIVSVKDNIIKSVYATGKDVNVQPLKIMESGSHIYENLSINTEPTIRTHHKKYDIELSDHDMKTQALVKFGQIYAQIYMDEQTNEILAVRYLDSEALMNFKPYQTLNDTETREFNHDDKSSPYEQNSNQLLTLYEVTNEMRKLKGLRPLKVDKDVSRIAFLNLYQATSKEDVEFREDVLEDQLKERNILFKSAGQNVGSDFNDVPTLINSWLNSDIHRSRLLSTDYSQMGGEVNDSYYNLIFIEE